MKSLKIDPETTCMYIISERDRPVFYTTRFGKRSQLPSVRLYPDDLLNNNPLLNKMLNKGMYYSKICFT